MIPSGRQTIHCYRFSSFFLNNTYGHGIVLLSLFKIKVVNTSYWMLYYLKILVATFLNEHKFI